MIPDLSPGSTSGSRLRSLGNVRRARGYRLYTNDGRRIVDLWQDGGRAILGHGGGRAITEQKNALERGPNSPLPSVYLSRLEAAVRKLIQGSGIFRIFSNTDRALMLISGWLCQPAAPLEISDPVLNAAGPVRLWRPFLPDSHPPLAGLPQRWAVLPVLPATGDSPPQVVIFGGTDAPESDIVAQYRLAALSRGVHDLISTPPRSGLQLPGFRSVGPYLVAEATGRPYQELFDRLLARGFLISPDEEVPSIVPAEMSDGEVQLLRRVSAFEVQSESGNGD